ncbi:MAG: MFS transporter, partial [Halobacteriaceae archaeon]
IAGGYLADISMSTPWLVTGGLVALAVPVVYSFPREAHRERDDMEESTLTVLDVLPLLREKFTQPPLRSFVVLFGLLAGAFWGVNFFWQPVSRGVGLNVSRLGWMYAGFTVIGAVTTYRAGAIRDYLGVRSFFTFAPIVLGGVFAIVAVIPRLAIPAFFFMEGIFRVSSPLATQFINDQIETEGRATVLSAASMIRRLVIAPFQLGAGVLADIITPTETIGLFGVLLVAGSVLLLGILSPFRVNDQRVPGTASAKQD